MKRGPWILIRVSVLVAILLFGSCSATGDSNQIDNTSDYEPEPPGSSAQITSCERDDLERPVAVVEVSAPSATNSERDGGIYNLYLRVYFESTDGDTDYGYMDDSGPIDPGSTEIHRLQGVSSAPTAIRCILNVARMD